MIGGFVARHVAAFSEEELDQIEAVLEHWDVDLADWLSGRRAIPPEADTPMLRRMAADPRLAGIPVIVISAHAQDAVSSELGGDIRISRSSSFRLGEIIRVLEALFDALGPGWQ